jgi:hypothetical protein
MGIAALHPSYELDRDKSQPIPLIVRGLDPRNERRVMRFTLFRSSSGPYVLDRSEINAMSDGIIPRDVPWRERSLALRTFGALYLSCWIVSMASLLVLGGIETVALKQPKEPTGIYQHPYEVKSSIRYLTDLQDQIHGVAHPVLIVFFVLGACAAAGYEIVRRREYDRRKQAFFDKVSG